MHTHGVSSSQLPASGHGGEARPTAKPADAPPGLNGVPTAAGSTAETRNDDNVQVDRRSRGEKRPADGDCAGTPNQRPRHHVGLSGTSNDAVVPTAEALFAPATLPEAANTLTTAGSVPLSLAGAWDALCLVFL